MTNLLVLDSSASGQASVSAQLTGELVARLRAQDPSLLVTHRDLGAAPLPHLTADTLSGLAGGNATEAARETAARSDNLIAELQAAEIILVGSPMYNFGVSTALKTWFDHVLRAGVTFHYTPEGPKGHLTGKRAIVVETRGGLFSEGPNKTLDAQEPHIKAMFFLLGITDVTFVRAERLSFGPEARQASITAAVEELHGLAKSTLQLAA